MSCHSSFFVHPSNFTVCHLNILSLQPCRFLYLGKLLILTWGWQSQQGSKQKEPHGALGLAWSKACNKSTSQHYTHKIRHFSFTETCQVSLFHNLDCSAQLYIMSFVTFFPGATYMQYIEHDNSNLTSKTACMPSVVFFWHREGICESKNPEFPRNSCSMFLCK